jgi:hypothetical protein
MAQYLYQTKQVTMRQNLRIFIWSVCCTLFLAAPAAAQRGFFIPIGKRQVDIPFEYHNNLIIIQLRLNGLLPLKFIFDTGAEHTILTEREFGDLMRLKYERSFQVVGSDLSTVLTAWLARDVRLEVPEKMVAPQEDILVLEDDYFHFEEQLGVEIHGILSGNSLSRYIIRINYQKQVITLIERESFGSVEKKGFTATPMSILRTKPYVHTQVHLASDSTLQVRLLVDTGAGVPLMIFENTHNLLEAPPNAIPSMIGQGLGGDLGGFAGRIPQLEFGPNGLNNVLTYYQTLDSIRLSTHYVPRNGLIGNLLLSRFIVILDYSGQQIWLKPTRYIKEAFVYDRSGMTLIAGGPNLRTYTVQYVLVGSPAHAAGILPGDVLVRVRRSPALLMDLSRINLVMQGKPGQKIPLKLKRDGKIYKTQVTLRDLI